MTAPSWLPLAISASGTIIALSAFAYQVHRARFNQSVDLLFRLENDFFGPDKVTQRSLAAKNHLADPNDFMEMEDVLDFFETISMLTRKKALDLFMVWHTFDYWMERYYSVAKPYIAKRQAVEPGVWEDLDWLMPRLKKLQAKKGSSNLDESELNRFLAEEAAET
jgi:hypothetical protein